MEHYIVDRLNIPKLWLIEATALALRRRELHEDETRCLIEAGMWDEAHSALITHIAPQSIISGRLHCVQQLLEKFIDVRNVQGWEYGGQVYKDAVELFISAKDIDNSDNNARNRRPQIERLKKVLDLMRQQTFEQRVAKHEIAALLIRLLPYDELVSHNLSEQEQLSNGNSIRLCSLAQYEVA